MDPIPDDVIILTEIREEIRRGLVERPELADFRKHFFTVSLVKAETGHQIAVEFKIDGMPVGGITRTLPHTSAGFNPGLMAAKLLNALAASETFYERLLKEDEDCE